MRCLGVIAVAVLLCVASVAAEGLGTGPDPDLSCPAVDGVTAVCARLADGVVLTPPEVDLLLRWTLHHARMGILAYTREFAGDRPVTISEAFGPESLAGHCELGAMLCTFILEDLGIDGDALWWCNAARSFGDDPHYHGFVVAHMPDGVTYLLDPTFRQFLVAEGHVGRPGRILATSEAGRHLARRLCRHGYVVVDDDEASRYGRALGGVVDEAVRFPLTRIRDCNGSPMPFTRVLVGEGILPELPLARRNAFLRLWSGIR